MHLDERRLRGLLRTAIRGDEAEWLSLAAWCYATAWVGRMFGPVPLRVPLPEPDPDDEPRGETAVEIFEELVARPLDTEVARHVACLQVLRAVDAQLARVAPGYRQRVPLPPEGGHSGTVEIRKAHWSTMRALREEYAPRGHGRMRYDTLPGDVLRHLRFHWEEAPERELVLHDHERDDDDALLRLEPVVTQVDAAAYRVALCPLLGAAPRFVTRQTASDGLHDHFRALDHDPLRQGAVDALLAEAAKTGVGVVVLPELGVRPSDGDLRRWRGKVRLLVAGSWHVGGDEAPANRAPVVGRRILWRHDKSGEFRLQKKYVRRPLFPDAPDVSLLDEEVEERIRRGRQLRTLDSAVWGRFGIAICADVLSPNGARACLHDAQRRVDTLFVPSLSPDTDGFVSFAQEAAGVGLSLLYVNNGVVLEGAAAPVVLAFASLAFGDSADPPLVRWSAVGGAPRDHVEAWNWKAKVWERIDRSEAYRLDPSLGLVVDLTPIRRKRLPSEAKGR